MDSIGTGIIDQSDVLTLQVTTFAALASPSLMRADSVKTVGELSSIAFTFTLNLPVDPDCRIRVTFPSDQPLTPDLTSSTGTNLFSSAYGLSALDLPLNYAEVAGCSTYFESA